MPISIILAIVIQNNKILLIKRKKGQFVNLLAIPGGKIEKNEHLKSAVKRELKEEAQITADFEEYLGCVSEILIENNEVKANFILHLCKLKPKTNKILNSDEGDVNWYNLSSLNSIKDQIIPSDFKMIENFVLNKTKNYFDCIEEKIGNKYYLKKFT